MQQSIDLNHHDWSLLCCRHPMNSKPAQVRPHPASGSHPSVAPPMPSPSQPQPTHQQALPAAQQPSHNASAGGSSQSAQTAAPKDLKGKSGHARASAAAGDCKSVNPAQSSCMSSCTPACCVTIPTCILDQGTCSRTGISGLRANHYSKGGI